MPYKTPLTFTYDSGRFEENLDRTMKLADWKGFEARRKEAARRGMLRGIGISNTIEFAADPTIETAEIRFDPLGGMTFVTGSISHGQGHATVQTQNVGRFANPLLVKGQIMGGIAQDMGQVLMEDKAYDIEGQVLPARSWTTPCRARRTSATW
jgi:CO/xanthine dehydrogenase Mo-binding subunit